MIDGRTGLRHAAKTCAVLKTFAGIDTHYGVRQMGLELIEDGFACTDRQTGNTALDDAADGISLTLISGYHVGKLTRIGLCADLD